MDTTIDSGSNVILQTNLLSQYSEARDANPEHRSVCDYPPKLQSSGNGPHWQKNVLRITESIVYRTRVPPHSLAFERDSANKVTQEI